MTAGARAAIAARGRRRQGHRGRGERREARRGDDRAGSYTATEGAQHDDRTAMAPRPPPLWGLGVVSGYALVHARTWPRVQGRAPDPRVDLDPARLHLRPGQLLAELGV